MPFGLYLHVPYCRRRCSYCDFYTNPLAGPVPDTYVDALLAAYTRYAPTEDGTPARPHTVYFGGGTPSLLAPAQVARLLQALNPAPGAEITLEANPESATEAHLAAYRAAGVNRLSLGVQSASDQSLAALGRLHTADAARRALAAARKAGFENISGDIMLALPGYTNAAFDDVLGLLAEGGATHISAYLLKIEPGTPLGENPPQNLPTPDEAADAYLYAVQALAKAGYAQYEVSNFARPGYQSRHNLNYWHCGDYLGLGPAAHGCLQGRRFHFPPDTAAFVQGATPVEDGSCGAEDYIMLQLRLATGLCEEALAERFGRTLTTAQRSFFQGMCTAGLATHTGDAWRLTPEGLLVQNSILARLL